MGLQTEEMERVENDKKSQFFYAFAANPGFIEIPIIRLNSDHVHGFGKSYVLCQSIRTVKRIGPYSCSSMIT